MSDRILYWMSGSPPCWRVMAVLKEKGLEYESKLVNASKGVSRRNARIPSLAHLQHRHVFHEIDSEFFKLE